MTLIGSTESIQPKYTPEEKAARLAKIEASKGGKRGRKKRI